MSSSSAKVYMPLTNSRDAPVFSSSYIEFGNFFENVSQLVDRAGLENKEKSKIDWAIRYAGSEAESWRLVPCMSSDDRTFDKFKKEVTALYPNLDENCRYTNEDLQRLVNNTRQEEDMTRDDLGIYLRKFQAISGFLISKSRLYPRDQNLQCLRGFPGPMRKRMRDRLAARRIETKPEDGYEIADIREAAEHVLRAPEGDEDDESEPKGRTNAQRSPEMDELFKLVANLTRVVSANTQAQQQPRPAPPPVPRYQPQFQQQRLQPAPGGANLNAPPWNPPRGQEQGSGCMFCGGLGHYVRDCPVAAQYIQHGKIVWNNENKLVLPDGRFVPRNLPGNTMRERVDYYLSPQGQRELGRNQDYVATNFLETPDEFIFEFDVSPDEPGQSPDELTEQYLIYEAQQESLRDANVYAAQRGRREQFDGVQVPQKIGFPPRRNPPAPPAPQPNVHGQRALSKPLPGRDVPPHLVGKSGAPAVPPPPRPQGPIKPIAMPPKPTAEESKRHYHSAIENSVKTSDLLDRALDTPITISTRELLATSVDARKHLKDLVTTKMVSSNLLEEGNRLDSYLTSFGVPSPSPISLDVYKYATSSPTAAASLPLRTIRLQFGDSVEAECILDGGAQIVVMRKDIWEKLRTPITADKAQAMESANSETSYTLGLVENQLVKLGPIQFYLQIQVVPSAPFEVLLGRPFFDVLNCVEISRSGGTHQIEVREPETGTPYMFATQPRGRKTSREAAVNFRS